MRAFISYPWFCIAFLLWNSISSGYAQEIIFGFEGDGGAISRSEIIRGNKTGNVLGFCGALADYLEGEGHKVIAQELRTDQRLDVFAESLQGKAGIECGPLSKTREREKGLNKANHYQGVFSKVFLVTSTKILIRNSKINDLYNNPQQVRIGVIGKTDGSSSVTSALIASALPNTQIHTVANRTEAIQRLRYASNHPKAIDAYASDEVILYDMRRDLTGLPEGFTVEPPLYGYSREEYVLVVYNAPDWVEHLNQWLDSKAGQQALTLIPVAPQEVFARRLTWLARGDRLGWLKVIWYGVLALLVLSIMTLIILLRQRSHIEPSSTHIPLYYLPKPIEIVVDEPTTIYHPESTSVTITVDTVEERQSVLTEREKEVLVLVVQGYSNKEIARLLDINHRTIETHRKNIYTKLGTSSPLDLVDYVKKYSLLKTDQNH